MLDGKTGGVESIDVTPDYSAMFAGFLHDARAQAKSVARKPDDCIKLEDLQAVLSRLNVAAAAMSSVEEIQEFRDGLNQITGLVAAEARRRDGELEESEDIIGECVPGSKGRYRFVPDGEEAVRHAALDARLFEHVETVYADSDCEVGYGILRRLDDGKLFALSDWTSAETAYEIVRTGDAEES